MKTKKIITIGLCAWALLLAGCNNNTANPQLDEFAKCVTEAWAKVYGADTCPHCQDQKKLFWDSYEYIDYIDCNKTPKQCSDASIEKIPTWEFNDGTKEVWKKSLEELAAKTNCELK